LWNFLKILNKIFKSKIPDNFNGEDNDPFQNPHRYENVTPLNINAINLAYLINVYTIKPVNYIFINMSLPPNFLRRENARNWWEFDTTPTPEQLLIPKSRYSKLVDHISVSSSTLPVTMLSKWYEPKYTVFNDCISNEYIKNLVQNIDNFFINDIFDTMLLCTNTIDYNISAVWSSGRDFRVGYSDKPISEVLGGAIADDFLYINNLRDKIPFIPDLAENIMDYTDYKKPRRNYAKKIFINAVNYLNERHMEEVKNSGSSYFSFSSFNNSVPISKLNDIIIDIKRHLFCYGPLGVEYFDTDRNHKISGIIIGWESRGPLTFMWRVRIPTQEVIQLVKRSNKDETISGIDIADFDNDLYGPYHLDIVIQNSTETSDILKPNRFNNYAEEPPFKKIKK